MTSRSQVLVAAEIALVALTVAVVISLERLFTDLSFLSDVLLMALGSHLIAGVCRRAEISMALATPISGLSMVVLGTAIFYPDASALIIPTPETVDALGADLRDAWSVFSDDAAPVPPLRGFVVTTSVLVWYGVFLADWAAFRLRSPLEAVAPATAVFVFASLLGVDRNSIAHGTLFAAGVGAVLLAMRMERQVREEVWVADSAGRGISTTARVGLIAGACAVLLGAAAAPQLPGADGDPLVDVTDLDNGPQTRSV
ncbi:MAG: transglutaminaseTgpA domain-containing protein, partial [Actinomycetota bacterium]